MIDAIATQSDLASPLTTAVWGYGNPLSGSPSTSTRQETAGTNDSLSSTEENRSGSSLRRKAAAG